MVGGLTKNKKKTKNNKEKKHDPRDFFGMDAILAHVEAWDLAL